MFKNILRIILGSKSEKLKDIQARQNVRYSYIKERECIIMLCMVGTKWLFHLLSINMHFVPLYSTIPTIRTVHVLSFSLDFLLAIRVNM